MHTLELKLACQMVVNKGAHACHLACGMGPGVLCLSERLGVLLGFKIYIYGPMHGLRVGTMYVADTGGRILWHAPSRIYTYSALTTHSLRIHSSLRGCERSACSTYNETKCVLRWEDSNACRGVGCWVFLSSRMAARPVPRSCKLKSCTTWMESKKGCGYQALSRAGRDNDRVLHKTWRHSMQGIHQLQAVARL